MLKVHTSGITLRECRELESVLKEHGYSLAVTPDISDLQYRTMTYVGGGPPRFWLIVTAVSGGAGAIFATAFLQEAGKEAGKDAYKLVKKWLSEKVQAEDDCDREATIYPADGQPPERLSKGQ